MKTVPLGIAGLALVASGLFAYHSLTLTQDDENTSGREFSRASLSVGYGNEPPCNQPNLFPGGKFIRYFVSRSIELLT